MFGVRGRKRDTRKKEGYNIVAAISCTEFFDASGITMLLFLRNYGEDIEGFFNGGSGSSDTFFFCFFIPSKE